MKLPFIGEGSIDELVRRLTQANGDLRAAHWEHAKIHRQLRDAAQQVKHAEETREQILDQINRQ